MAITEINPVEGGRYEVVEVPAGDYVPRWARVSIPSRGLFIAAVHPRNGGSNSTSVPYYVWKGYPDGSFSKSAQSVPYADVFHAATENIVLCWEWSAAGFSSIYIDDNNEPTLVTSGSAPHVDYKNENNVMNWTYHEGNLILWGRKAWPNSAVKELWTAPISADGAIGSWSYIGPHSIPTVADTGGRGGTPRLAVAPNVNMLTQGSGNGSIITLDLEGSLDGTPLSQQAEPPGTDAQVNQWSYQLTWKRGPLMDRIVMYRNNLNADKPLEEWTWSGSGFELASRYWQTAEDMTLIPGAGLDTNAYWEVTPTTSGGLIARSLFLDSDYEDVGAVIYTDPFSTGIQKFTITSDNGYANHTITLFPVEVGDGETALAHAYDYANGDVTNPLNERILIIRPKTTIVNRMVTQRARFARRKNS